METKNNNLGLFQAVKGSIAALLEIGKTRAELLLTEVKIEKQKVMSAMIFGVVGAFCLLLFFIMLVAVLVIAFWDAKIYILAGFAVLFFVLSTMLFCKAKKLISKPSKFGDDSIAELQKDILLLKQELGKTTNQNG